MAQKKKNSKIPYTEKELQLIKETPIVKLKDLAFLLGRKESSVRRKKWAMENKERDVKAKLEYKKKINEELTNGERKYNYWSKMEEDFLMESKLTDIEIAKHLKRSLGSIQVKRARLLRDKNRRKRNARRKRNK